MNTFEDINRFYSNRNPDHWNFAPHYVPPFFESKFIVHWAYGIIAKFPFDEYPLEKETLEDINKRVKIEREFGVLLKDESLYEPISIIDLAKRFNVPFSHKTTTLIPETPGTSSLEILSLIKLKDSLKVLSRNAKMNLLIYDLETYNYQDDLQSEYFDISIETYLDIQEMFGFQLGTCLFSDNFEWCLITAENAPVILGCKKEFVDDIEKKVALELFKIDDGQEIY